jgi:hypothetical protein
MLASGRVAGLGEEGEEREEEREEERDEHSN